MIDFEVPEELRLLETRVEALIREEIIPLEADARQHFHGPTDELRLELVDKARAAGLLSPHISAEWGGLGLSHVGKAIVFEAAGYSTLGPLALNIQAPDEGNAHLLEQVATPAQKERWLRPLAEGRIRSAFSMTEPDGGAGSDPSLMKTTARESEGGFRVNGRKWIITGFPDAQLHILMARTEDRAGNDLGATMFLLDPETAGVEFVRMLDTLDSNSPGGHCELRFADVLVPHDRVLGEVGKGFRYAQVRLAPARLTHCMRWLGAARRCHDIAVDYARERRAFGRPIGEHEGIGFQLVDNELDLHLSRLATWHAAWLLDRGERARRESSACKIFCSEALGRVVDRSLQVLGGKGITADTVIERIYRDIRAFRIYDGPSEVHRFALARDLMKGAT